jgi:hypothetical protein
VGIQLSLLGILGRVWSEYALHSFVSERCHCCVECRRWLPKVELFWAGLVSAAVLIVAPSHEIKNSSSTAIRYLPYIADTATVPSPLQLPLPFFFIMDPLSIAATSAGLVVTCVKITGLLYTWIDGTRNIDKTVSGFCEEVLILSRVLEAVGSAWKSNPSIAAAQAATDGQLWRCVKMTLDDCQGTLETLDEKLNEVKGSNSLGMRIFGKANKQIRLNLRMTDLTVYRQRVQYHNSAVQMALQMINV